MIFSTLATLSFAGGAQRFGVNIHFTIPAAGEAQQLATGFRTARRDFTWDVVEKATGQYNFSRYDGLYASLSAAGVRSYWILDYGNPLYDGGDAPRTDAGRAAFAAFAVASMAHFAGRGIIWELWNEVRA
jgi:hypothetical protein